MQELTAGVQKAPDVVYLKSGAPWVSGSARGSMMRCRGCGPHPGNGDKSLSAGVECCKKKKSEPLLCGLSPQSDFCHSVLIIPIHISSDSYCALVRKGFSYISDFNYAQSFFLFMLKFSFLSRCSCCTWKDCAAHGVYGTEYGPYWCHFLYLFLRCCEIGQTQFW